MDFKTLALAYGLSIVIGSLLWITISLLAGAVWATIQRKPVKTYAIQAALLGFAVGSSQGIMLVQKERASANNPPTALVNEYEQLINEVEVQAGLRRSDYSASEIAAATSANSLVKSLPEMTELTLQELNSNNRDILYTLRLSIDDAIARDDFASEVRAHPADDELSALLISAKFNLHPHEARNLRKNQTKTLVGKIKAIQFRAPRMYFAEFTQVQLID